LLSVNSAESSAWLRKSEVNFSGEFQVISVRHIGDYMSPDGSNAWVTIYETVALAKK
jgi:hypothetical protein